MFTLVWDNGVLRSWLAGLMALSLVACASTDPEEGQAEGAMEEAKQLVDHVAGKACESDKDCENGSCRDEVPAFPFENREAQSAPGGFCSFACNISADCGEGSLCIGAGESVGSFDMDDRTGLCLAACSDDEPCREGYSCVDLFGQTIGSENAVRVSTGSCQPQVEPTE